MQLGKLIETIDAHFPPDTALDGDRTGLQLQSGRSEVRSVLFAYEMTPEVVSEAQACGAECIVAFHPLIYSPLKEICDDERVGFIATRLIQSGIALVSVHTRFDVYSEGTSRILSDLFGLAEPEFLVPNRQHSGFGMGIVGRLERPIPGHEFVELVSERLGAPVRFAEGSAEPVGKVAIVGGSGTSFLGEALRSGAQAFVTADSSYHRFHEVRGKLWLVDPGHFEMEQFTSYAMASALRDALGQAGLEQIMISREYTNPVRYFPDTDKYIRKQNQILNNYIR